MSSFSLGDAYVIPFDANMKENNLSYKYTVYTINIYIRLTCLNGV